MRPPHCSGDGITLRAVPSSVQPGARCGPVLHPVLQLPSFVLSGVGVVRGSLHCTVGIGAAPRFCGWRMGSAAGRPRWTDGHMDGCMDHVQHEEARSLSTAPVLPASRHCRCTAPHLRGGTRPSPAVASAAPGDGRGTQFGKNGKKWQRPSSSEQNTHFRQRDSRLPAAPRAAPRRSRSA